ncbi:glycosyltransferase [Microbacterium pumilum]|uniref:Glycosyltransferase n=1 Tax=Microbacterium pumilum TaxID=344165 RepID=A0ABN2SEB0_9MICO
MSQIRELTRLARRFPPLSRVLETGDPRRRARRLIDSGLIDPALYARQLGVPRVTVEEAAAHYTTIGYREDYTINALLDPRTIAGALMRTNRPVLFDYVNSRAWHAHVSRVWDVAKYREEHPESLDHRGGPVGHLWERLQASSDSQLRTLGGGPRELPWREVYRTLSDAYAEAAAARREKQRRLPRSHTNDLIERGVAWPAREPRPLVSIIMPVWNRPMALRRAIESVLAQDWVEWELLIVDDGSWDDTVLVARTIAARDDRVRVLERPHGGVCRARNAGIDAARGSLIAFLDSDNAWEPTFLSDMMNGMRHVGAEAAFATIELHNAGTVRYRDQDVDHDSLRLGNSIDLNTLIVTRGVIDRVGGFDPTLARAVDYDLILRIAEGHRIHHIDTIGAVYDDSEDADDRISTTEPLGWNTLVRLRHDGVLQAMAEPTALLEGTDVFVMVHGDELQLADKIDDLIDLIEDESVGMTIVTIGCDAGRQSLADVAAIGRPSMARRSFDGDEPFAYVVDSCLAAATRTKVVFIDPTARASAETVRLLAAEVGSDVPVALPVNIGPDGTLQGTGAALARTGSIPALLLADHPVEDWGTEDADVPLASGRSFAADTSAVRAVGGLDPLLFNDFELESLSLKLIRANSSAAIRVVASAQLWHPVPATPFSRTDPKGNSRAIRALSSGVVVPTVQTVYGPRGFDVVHWEAAEARGEGGDREPQPRPHAVLARRHAPVEVDGETLPRLRWAIKIAAPAGPRGEAWGDLHFARALARALSELGQEAVIDHREAHHRSTSYLDDVELVIRGLDKYEPRGTATSMLWVISHPDMVKRAEAEPYDAVFAASIPWAKRISQQWGLDVEPLLQCTDPSLFSPHGDPRTDDLVFVGNSRWVPRPAVVEPIRNGIDLKVYGADWGPFIPEESVTAPHIDNREVGRLYESASVVLNDHWNDMKREGFISNRLFDVVASGGRALSDPVEGIEEIFGGSVAVFPSSGDLVPMIRSGVDSLFPDDEELARLGARIREEHSFLARARVLLARALAVRAR